MRSEAIFAHSIVGVNMFVNTTKSGVLDSLLPAELYLGQPFECFSQRFILRNSPTGHEVNVSR